MHEAYSATKSKLCTNARFAASSCLVNANNRVMVSVRVSNASSNEAFTDHEYAGTNNFARQFSSASNRRRTRSSRSVNVRGPPMIVGLFLFITLGALIGPKARSSALLMTHLLNARYPTESIIIACMTTSETWLKN